MTSSFNLLSGKTALITGTNRGIGKTILETFAMNGADIIACARRETDEFISFINGIKDKYGIDIHPLFFDLSKDDEIKNALKEIVNKKTRIDILVNNAGIAYGGFLQMTSINKIKEVFDINFFAPMLITQYVSKLMIHQKQGSIINIASVVALENYPGYSAYGSSKAALIYATKTLSGELAPYNIRINAIAAGLTNTDMANQMEVKAKEGMLKDSAMKRMASTEEIANSVLFLASDLSSFVNGQVLRVDGGM